QRRLIRRALSVVHGSAVGLTFRHVSDVLARVVDARHGAKLDLPGGIVVERDGALTTVGRSGVGGRASAGANWATGVSLSVPGAVRLGEEGPRLLALEGGEPVKGRADGRSALSVDADRLGCPRTARNWRPGAWFCPSGRKGQPDELRGRLAPRAIRRPSRT